MNSLLGEASSYADLACAQRLQLCLAVGSTAVGRRRVGPAAPRIGRAQDWRLAPLHETVTVHPEPRRNPVMVEVPHPGMGPAAVRAGQRRAAAQKPRSADPLVSESPLLEIYQGCPLCGADSRRLGTADCTGHPLWHAPLPGTLEWMECEACGHVHTRGFWTAAGLAEVFRNLNETQVLRASDNIDAIRATWAPVVERVIGLLGGYRQAMAAPEPPAWVDVGCGNGGLLMAAGDFGFSAMGVDARSETAEQLRGLGFNAVSGNFVDVPLAKRFHIDVLSMMDVLEHLPYPKRALEKAARIVRPGGVLVVSLPDLTCS
ncbi:MAG: class I SAM-dependent methyltransferase, partial [Proteobacteria bacterium]|nr:class I SAM-dependent methyltransferase [Pseudomonadota bacterium]